MIEIEFPRDLLREWQAADPEAFSDDLAWIRRHVSRRLGPRLRTVGNTSDFVQEAMLKVLRYGPRFKTRDRRQFRALFTRVVENVLREKARALDRKKRSVSREKALLPVDVVDLDGDTKGVSTRVEERELAGLTALALELLRPEEREVIVERDVRGRTFVEIATKDDVTPDGIRMRHKRAVKRLAKAMAYLGRQRGRSGDSDPDFDDDVSG